MTTQVTHESEISRQHARYKIPAKLVIGQHPYPVFNWSVSGMAVHLTNHIHITEEKHLKGRLVFRFGDIATATSIELEEIYRDENQKVVGYRYINLKRSQVSVLHHVINAYLSGEILDVGNVIEIIKRDAFTTENKDKKIAQIANGQNRFVFQVRRFFGTLALLAVLFGLLGFIGYNTYQRIFVIESIAASVNAPVVIIRSPVASYFEALPVISKGSELKKGELLATLRLINGGAANIESPCDCTIIATHVPYEIFVNEGEPLLTLLPTNNGDLFIEAKFDNNDIEKLALNQVAKIELVNGQQLTGTVSRILSGETLTFKHSSQLKNVSTDPVSYVNVVITPDTKLDTDLLGSVATVTIDTYGHDNTSQ